MQSLVELLRHDPKLMTMAVSARGGTGHLAAAGLGQRLGIEPLIVQYRGTAPVITDILHGSIALTVVDVAPVLPHIREGRLQAYAVLGPESTPIAPEIPSIREVGFSELYFEGWTGIWGPRGMQKDLVD